MPQVGFDDPAFLARLRQGESAAYRALIRRFHGSLVGVAASVIGSRAQAEEVVQDAWLAVFSGIGRFEGRSSIVTWLFSIVLNRARTRAGREGRLVGLPALMEGTPPGERAVPLSAFKPDGHWVEVPRLWDEIDPERIVGGRQLWDHVQGVIERLPAGQRAVIILRDMEGRTAGEACELLAISAENQRVLLHRARGRIRQAMDALTGAKLPAAPAFGRTQPSQRRGGNPAAVVITGKAQWGKDQWGKDQRDKDQWGQVRRAPVLRRLVRHARRFAGWRGLADFAVPDLRA
jgi:RNA polymerase sigma-70 factor (ECF subfamily)